VGSITGSRTEGLGPARDVTLAAASAMLEPTQPDGLATHLGEVYGVEVTAIAPLDAGVFRVDMAGGERWVARVFPAARPLEIAQQDANLLAALERGGFPAERCARPDSVSVLAGQAVLVTGFIEDHGPLRPGRSAALLGALLGGLHARPAATARPGGAWHHLSFTGGPREEVAAAAELLDEHLSRVSVRQLALFDRLRDEVAATDDCHDLPHSFVHPDFVSANAIVTADEKLAIVDWAGAGRGPRLWSLGFLLFAAGAANLRLVELVVSRYRRSIELEPRELERLEGAIRGRPVMLEAWSVCAGRRELDDALYRITQAGELAGTIAARAREAFAAPPRPPAE
jgi:aminoglycoside phosphotransferase (APT) family kinase protein